jgi:hypothetical protein
MVRVLVLALLAALLMAPGVFAAEAQAAPCFGAPADYVAAFDGKDGTVDGQVNYPEPRVYIEVQGWLTKVGATPGQASEHMHSGLCYPHGAPWANQVARLEFKHTFFNMLGYRVTTIRGGIESAGIGVQAKSPMPANTLANLAELNAAENASAGGNHATVFQSYALNIPQATCSGRGEFRTGIKVVSDGSGKALVAEWFTSTGWQAYLPAGKPQCSFQRGSDAMINRNWASNFDYGNNSMGVVDADTAANAKPEPYPQKTGFGAGTNRGSLHADPDFHHGFNGIFSAPVTSDGQVVSVPTQNFTPEVHKIALLAHEGGGTRITSTVVGVLPIRVS